MEIAIKKENLSEYNIGGGYRELEAVITVDSTLPPRMQRHVAIYETLGLLLDPLEVEPDKIDEIANKLNEVLDQLD